MTTIGVVATRGPVLVELAALADYVAITNEGKLVIAGIFDSVSAPSLPVALPVLHMAIRITADPAEPPEHKMTLNFIGPSGAELRSFSQEFRLPEKPPIPGAVLAHQFVVKFAGAMFEDVGAHAIDILLDDKYARSVSFNVSIRPDVPGT